MSQEKSSNELNSPREIRWGWVIFGLIAVAIAATLILIQKEGTFEYYMTVAEYLENPAKYSGSKIKLAGKVKAASLHHQDDIYKFTIEDRGQEIAVTYKGLAPDTFKEGVDVVVEGKASSEKEFEAKSLLAKCASKYEAGGLPPLEQMRSQSRR